MRILYFSRDYTPHDHRFLLALSETEHQVVYLRLEQRGHVLEDRPLPVAIEVIPWKGGQGPATLKDGPKLLLDLQRLLRQVKPDIVQAGPVQRSALLVALAGFHPLVTMSWGYDLLKDAEINAGWRWATRFTLKRSDLLVGDCQTIRKLAVAYGMRDECIVTFPWGVDIQHFSPAIDAAQDNNRDPGTFTILSTRAWEPIYGVDVIARAFVKASREHPGLRLIMLGNGSQASLLRQIFVHAGVDERVFFPGHIGYAALPHYYHMADLYVSESHSDGSSISLLEAMACGKPVLVSNIPGNLEWVTSGQNGWTFTDGDDEALTEAIHHAVCEQARLPAMGQEARRVAVQRADWSVNFQGLLKAYQRGLVFQQ